MGKIYHSSQFKNDKDLEFFKIEKQEDASYWIVGYSSHAENQSKGAILCLNNDYKIVSAKTYFPRMQSLYFSSISVLPNNTALFAGSHTYWYGEVLGGYLLKYQLNTSKTNYEEILNIKQSDYNISNIEINFGIKNISGFSHVNSVILPVKINETIITE